MGIGLGTSLLGGILSLFGGKKAEAGGEPAQPKAQTDEFAGMKALYPDGTFSKIGDTYYAIIDGTRYESNSLDGLMDQIPSGKKSVAAPKQDVTDKPVDKPNNSAPQLSALEQQYQQNTDGYSPVKFDGANFADIFKNLTGVFDYGKDKNGKEIGDFADAKADLKGKTSFKEGDTISIGGKDYKIVKSEDGFVYLKDAKSTRNGDQIYILEKTPSGGYQLSQRSFTNTEGFGKAAW